MNSDYCISNCLLYQKPITLYSSRTPLPSVNNGGYAENNIAEISAYSFQKMADREDHQVLAMWPTDFERLEEIDHLVNDDKIGPGFTSDVAAIGPDDFEKFFSKMKKTPLTREELK